MDYLIYDIEIIRCPQPYPEDPSIECCGGWRDFAGMGIACLCAYDSKEDRYRVFLEDNLQDFHQLALKRELVIGFNSLAFDDRLLAANGIEVKTDYDVLVEAWKAAGLPPYFVRGKSGGFSLGALCEATFGVGKSGSGALAPVLWQRGERGQVIDYCLHDVWLTRRLFDLRDMLVHPKTGGTLMLRGPEKSHA